MVNLVRLSFFGLEMITIHGGRGTIRLDNKKLAEIRSKINVADKVPWEFMEAHEEQGEIVKFQLIIL